MDDKPVTTTPAPSISSLSGLLADTWWFGLSQRLGDEAFNALARLRAAQGFSAIQLVAGIPPEVGPEHPDAASSVGPAWDLQGRINPAYLEMAVNRIQSLNAQGLRVIIYGSWGHQLDWTGADFMCQWWQALIEAVDHLDVIYCLCGEVGLWAGEADKLLPDLSTDDVLAGKQAFNNNPTAFSLSRKLSNIIYWRFTRPRLERQRRQRWAEVLAAASSSTSRPFLLHVNRNQLGREMLPNGRRLAANTTQTGHTADSRSALWQIPLHYLERHPDDHFINLEPWYEGIHDQFFAEDQIFAYWVSMLAGCCSYCYGAQGIWNVGNGRFMSHWGSQSFDEACELAGAALVGKSHRYFISHWIPTIGKAHTRLDTAGNLLMISRQTDSQQLSFVPAVERVMELPDGDIWLPMEARTTTAAPATGPAVIFSANA